jgi:hypothetical protein
MQELHTAWPEVLQFCKRAVFVSSKLNSYSGAPRALLIHFCRPLSSCISPFFLRYYRLLSSTQGQNVWDLWWAKWYCDRFGSQVFRFPCQYHFGSPVSTIPVSLSVPFRFPFQYHSVSTCQYHSGSPCQYHSGSPCQYHSGSPCQYHSGSPSVPFRFHLSVPFRFPRQYHSVSPCQYHSGSSVSTIPVPPVSTIPVPPGSTIPNS